MNKIFISFSRIYYLQKEIYIFLLGKISEDVNSNKAMNTLGFYTTSKQ